MPSPDVSKAQTPSFVPIAVSTPSLVRSKYQHYLPNQGLRPVMLGRRRDAAPSSLLAVSSCKPPPRQGYRAGRFGGPASQGSFLTGKVDTVVFSKVLC